MEINLLCANLEFSNHLRSSGEHLPSHTKNDFVEVAGMDPLLHLCFVMLSLVH